MPAIWKNAWAQQAQGPVVATEPFGRLEKVADGVWALISTPLTGDRTTVANGGLIAGKSGVLAIEGFYQPQGAAWLAARSRELTGRWPTHVLLTHYHADHVNGVAGYAGAQHPTILTTATTRDLAVERNQPADADRTASLKGVSSLDASRQSKLDLGGRKVRIVSLSGHTPSDLAVVLDGPDITFCGDLVWNGMFPNYVDAMPSQLARAVKNLRRGGKGVTYIPGHGAVASDADLARYQEMLDAVEAGARKAHAGGTPAKDAAAAFTLPTTLGEWKLFSPVFFERAFEAWYKELGG
jgi:glyoxylase-like metal-dependent hydrolase (beta-lactamase superfamily II)